MNHLSIDFKFIDFDFNIRCHWFFKKKCSNNFTHHESLCQLIRLLRKCFEVKSWLKTPIVIPFPDAGRHSRHLEDDSDANDDDDNGNNSSTDWNLDDGNQCDSSDSFPLLLLQFYWDSLLNSCGLHCCCVSSKFMLRDGKEPANHAIWCFSVAVAVRERKQFLISYY